MTKKIHNIEVSNNKIIHDHIKHPIVVLFLRSVLQFKKFYRTVEAPLCDHLKTKKSNFLMHQMKIYQ
jgi:hypothetical protein